MKLLDLGRTFILLLSVVAAMLFAGRASAETTLPTPLPAAVKAHGYLQVGVKCDFPPMGFIDASGKNAGFEIDVAHHLADLAFGNPDAVHFQCVSVASRIGFVTTHRLDFAIATATYTEQRAKVVDFSEPYFSAGGMLLVKKDSLINDLRDLAGKTIITITGTTYVPWSRKCFPHDRVLAYQGISDAMAALSTGRGDAFIEDNDLLIGLVQKYPGLRMTGGPPITPGPYGIIVAKDNQPMLAWINAALTLMQKNDEFWTLFTRYVTNPAEQALFSEDLPRPGHSLVYGTSASVLACP